MGSNQKKRYIIVADGNREFLQEFVAFFEPLKTEIRPVTSGREALSEIRQNLPYLLIINTALDDDHGLSIIDKIRKNHNSDIAFVVIMENDSLKLQEAVVKRNVLCKMIQPINLNDLMDIVVRVEREAMKR